MSEASVITRGILSHAATRHSEVALVIGAKSWSWSALADEIAHRAKALADSDPLLPTFTGTDFSVSESALNGLARLHLGLSIIGTTSGSTAAAKRYHRSQDSWIASFDAHQREFAVHAKDAVVAPGSLSHSLFSYALCHGLFVGAKVILSDSFRPDHALRQIDEHQGSILYGVPTQLKLIVQNQGNMAHDALSRMSVRLVLSSGARWFSEMKGALVTLFPKAEITEFYGASETSFVSLARHSSDGDLPYDSVGKPFYGVELKIADNDAIFIHSAGLFDGYLGKSPADVTDMTDAHGRRWISVGDCGRLDANGYLFLSGRQSRKIVTSGKNLYPEEVEQCLLTHAAIEYAAVFGIKDDLRSERLLAAIAIKKNTNPPALAELIAFLRPMLEDFKIPREFVTLDVWPMTATGKTDFAGVLQAAQGRP